MKTNPRKTFLRLVAVCLLLFCLSPAFTSCKKDKPLQKGECCICTGKYSKVYHLKDDCPALGSCKNGVKRLPIAELKTKYPNIVKPCRRCCKKKTAAQDR